MMMEILIIACFRRLFQDDFELWARENMRWSAALDGCGTRVRVGGGRRGACRYRVNGYLAATLYRVAGTV